MKENKQKLLSSDSRIVKKIMDLETKKFQKTINLLELQDIIVQLYDLERSLFELIGEEAGDGLGCPSLEDAIECDDVIGSFIAIRRKLEQIRQELIELGAPQSVDPEPDFCLSRESKSTKIKLMNNTPQDEETAHLNPDCKEERQTMTEEDWLMHNLANTTNRVTDQVLGENVRSAIELNESIAQQQKENAEKNKMQNIANLRPHPLTAEEIEATLKMFRNN